MARWQAISRRFPTSGRSPGRRPMPGFFPTSRRWMRGFVQQPKRRDDGQVASDQQAIPHLREASWSKTDARAFPDLPEVGARICATAKTSGRWPGGKRSAGDPSPPGGLLVEDRCPGFSRPPGGEDKNDENMQKLLWLCQREEPTKLPLPPGGLAATVIPTRTHRPGREQPPPGNPSAPGPT